MATILEGLFAMCVASIKRQPTVDVSESVREETRHPEGGPRRMMGLQHKRVLFDRLCDGE
jgi:hypothetical protein